jgi:phosphatidylinositol kinase/protein kinase (PI-3  family)
MEQMQQRIREGSVFGGLVSWKLVSLIVKTGDNLKQEQFAMQLIYQFCQIFESENLNLLLRPYEVVSLGPDSGII